MCINNQRGTFRYWQRRYWNTHDRITEAHALRERSTILGRVKISSFSLPDLANANYVLCVVLSYMA